MSKKAKTMITKPVLQKMISDYGQITHELGDEVPPRLCSKMVALLVDLEEWVEEIHPQATWPKNHGNQEEE